MRMVLLFGFLPLIGAIFIACSAPNAGTSATERDLEDMVLPLSAYGSEVQGFRSSPESGYKNTNKVQGGSFLHGYLLQFNAPPLRATDVGLLSVASGVTVFQDSDQAAEAFLGELENLRTGWLASRKGASAAFQEVKVGDEASILTLDTGDRIGSPLPDAKTILMGVMRRGDTIGTVSLFFGNESAPVEEVLRLLHLLDARITN